MTIEVLYALLLLLVRVEMPTVEDGSPRHAAYLAGMREMATHYVEVGKRGVIVSPEADPLILAAIGYGESRHQPRVKDGDCAVDGQKTVCAVVGPMQVHRGTMRWLATVDPSWRGVTLAQLREPRRNVEAAYQLLAYHRGICGAEGGPARLVSAWASGRCWPRAIATGSNRCHLASAMAVRAGLEPLACEGNVRSQSFSRLISALRP